MSIWLGSKWILSKQTAIVQHFFCRFFMSGRINHINATAEYTKSRKIAFQGLLMRLNIDAICEATNDQGCMWHQFFYQSLYHFLSIGCRLTSTHDAHGFINVEIGVSFEV